MSGVQHFYSFRMVAGVFKKVSSELSFIIWKHL